MNRIDTNNFLKKELKNLAKNRGDTMVEKQATFDDVSARKVKVKSKTKK